MNKEQKLKVSDVLQIPLALVSFVFFHIMKIIMRGFVALINNKKKDKLTPWRVISSNMITRPLVLPVFMTKAPRWNPHAIIGVVGPLKVESTIDINTAQAYRSASNWGIVMQSLEDGSEKKLSSSPSGQTAEWETLQLKKGYYTAALRYYGHSENINLPTINMNGEEVISSMPVDSNTNEFYKELRERKNLFYLMLNYYIYTMLRFSRWLPNSFVVKQYLPAADSDMEFKYGAIEKNNKLEISLETIVLSNYSVYLTFYDRASFPIQWYQINDMSMITPPTEETGYYLCRFILKPGGKKSPIDKNTIVNTLFN